MVASNCSHPVRSSRSALVEGWRFLGLGWLAAGGRGVGKQFLLLGGGFIDWRGGVGRILVAHHSIHQEHDKDQREQTGGTDGEGQRAQGTEGLAATRTALGFRGNGLKTAGAAFGLEIRGRRLDGVLHVLRAIYHRSRDAAVLPLVIIEWCELSQPSS
jgi:hypothetical protein